MVHLGTGPVVVDLGTDLAEVVDLGTAPVEEVVDHLEIVPEVVPGTVEVEADPGIVVADLDPGTVEEAGVLLEIVPGADLGTVAVVEEEADQTVAVVVDIVEDSHQEELFVGQKKNSLGRMSQ